MSTTVALADEYSGLYAEQQILLRVRNRSPEQDARLDAVTTRLLQIVAVPPDGYTVPAAAVQLLAHAEANGWQSLGQWTPPGRDEPFYTVHVGRVLRPGEMPDARSDRWKYQLTWHSRGCPPGRVRLFGRILGATPTSPALHEAPSVRAVRDVITAHPAPAETPESGR